jgi:hypothetical protein
MIITGIISLVDINGNVSSRRKYKSKTNRNEIISTWNKNYGLKNKNTFSFQILPDNPPNLLLNGYVCISTDKYYERKFYRSVEHREKIIKEFVSDNKLKKYKLEIMPNQ